MYTILMTQGSEVSVLANITGRQTSSYLPAA
jgi:hypothetical protein